MEPQPTPKPKYWYFIIYYECPVCGRQETLRERQSTPRPPRWEDRHEFVTRGCAGTVCYSWL